MRTLSRFACPLMLLVGRAVCQTPSKPQEDAMRELRDAVAALRQACDELQETRKEMDDLRREVDTLRAELKASAPSSSPESADQLASIQEEQQIQSSRLEQQNQTKIESGSRYRVRLSGIVLFNASMNAGGVNDQDVPNLVVNSPNDASAGNISATVRQTLFTFDVTGPRFAGARTSARATFDFFGGFPNTRDGTTMGIARLRTASADFSWEKWSLRFGQEQPFISPNNPSSLASVSVPALGYSGNMWTWTPQVVVRRNWKLSENAEAATQFGLLDPLSGEFPQDEYLRKPDAGERSRIPALAIRQSFSTNLGDESLELGVGGYYARHNYGYDRNEDAWAATLDWQLPLTNWLGVSGEFFRGRVLGGLWGGIGTSVVYTAAPDDPAGRVIPIDAIGGWSQVKFKLNEKLELNAAFGQDNPFANDLRQQWSNASYSPVLRNQTVLANVIRRLRSNLLVSLEYRHLNSSLFDGNRRTAEHINAAIGVEF